MIVEKVMSVKNTVSNREILHRRAFLNIDIDEFDFMCDHPIIIDKKIGKGCSSVNTTDIIEISLIYDYVKRLYLSSEDLRVYTKEWLE